jgi:hypothetical protein
LPEALVDELAHIVRADAALDRLADCSGDLFVVARAVRQFGDEVEERRELDDLAVGTPNDVGSFFEAGALVLPDQLDVFGELRFLGRRSLGRRRLIRDRQNLRLLLFGRGGDVDSLG